MRLQFLGSAAAEGIPALFCDCDLCRRAALNKGMDLRFRSGALVDSHILLDLTPDLFAQQLRFSLDLSKIDALFLTHSHTDHLASGELVKRSTANYCHIRGEKPLDVYGNEKVCYLIRQALELEFGVYSDRSLALHILEPMRPMSLGNLRITPLPALHDPKEQCLLYLLEDEGGSMLYANDTGVLPEETFQAISFILGGRHLDAVSLDCTFGSKDREFSGHMGIGGNLLFREALFRHGCADKSTHWYVTHFSHNCGMTHQELCGFFEEKGFTVVYDGLSLSIAVKEGG